MRMLKVVAATLGLAVSANCMAEGDYFGTVTYVGTLGDGTVFVELPQAITIGTCSSPQVRIAPNNPARKEFLAIAMSAYLTGTYVKIQTDSCMGSYPTLGNSTNSWIYLRP